jgi:PTH1 family peptidyl-tRNA hydrolase
VKYLIVGLGNIGSEYDKTRHNIGFDIVNKAVQDLDTGFKTETLGSVAEAKWKGRTLVFLKPSTYMNLSGKAVHYWMQKLKIPLENLLVIVDDIHLDLGKLRLRDKGSDGGHNGLKDIQTKLGHSNYVRLRVGVGKDFFPGQQVQYVLGKWKKEEEKAVEEMIEKSVAAIKNFSTIGLKLTMDQLNR